MKWLERIGFIAVGALLSIVVGASIGRITLGGDFLANIAGASIGGMISVGLAIMMFTHQRKITSIDAKDAAKKNWDAAIRESLRHVRAIKDAVEAGRGITINNSVRLSQAIAQTSALTVRALQDPNLTDFRLRLAMEEASQIGHQVSQTLPASLAQERLTEADVIALSADRICDPAIKRLDELIAEYTRVRNLPTI